MIRQIVLGASWFFTPLFTRLCIMPADTPGQDGSSAPAPKVDFTAAMAKVKALAAKLGNSASNAPAAAAPSAPTPAPAKRSYEDDSYHSHDSRGDDPYGKRMAYDSGRGMRSMTSFDLLSAATNKSTFVILMSCFCYT